MQRLTFFLNTLEVFTASATHAELFVLLLSLKTHQVVSVLLIWGLSQSLPTESPSPSFGGKDHRGSQHVHAVSVGAHTLSSEGDKPMQASPLSSRLPVRFTMATKVSLAPRSQRHYLIVNGLVPKRADKEPLSHVH